MRAIPIAAGDTFGRWTTLEGSRTGKRALVLCRCECGTEKTIEAYSLRTGNSKSCGCLHREILRAPRARAYIKVGDVSHRLTALEGRDGAKGFVRCRCECGVVTDIRAALFKQGRTRSCGCLARDVLEARNVTHGMRHHPLYNNWHAMMSRCFCPTQPGYEDYGGRGITVCERWRDPVGGILNFIADMGLKPGPKYSVERRDVDGDYTPENCRWATPKEQAANMRPRARRAQLETLLAENRELRDRVAELEALLEHLTSEAAA